MISLTSPVVSGLSARDCFLQVATLSSSKITWAQSQYSLWNSKHRIPSAQALFKSLLVSHLLTSIGQGKSHGQPNSVMRKQIPLLNGRIFNIILPGVRCRKRKNFWPSFNLPLLSYPKHTRHIHTCAQAGPITWNKLSTSFCPFGKFLFLDLQGSDQIQHLMISFLKLIIPSYAPMIPCICLYYSIQ